MPLVGARRDGHEFISDALARGAAGFLCQRDQALAVPSSAVAIRVRDTACALRDLARWAAQRLHAHVIAVAGSNGKTTTKELIAQVLAQRFHTHATVSNQNTEIGLALTVLNAPEDTEMLVLEMGTTALGEIAQLCAITPPKIGVLTSITEEHLETLGSFESVIEAETELLEALPSDGIALVNGDDPHVLAVARRKTKGRLFTFGFAPHNDFVAEEIALTRSGTTFWLRSPKWQNELNIALLGRPAVLAALAATAVAQLCGLSFGEIRCGLRNARPVWGRLQVVSIPDTAITVLHDAYNANPASMREALLCAAQIRDPDETLIFVLGDMLELGALSERAHREIGRFLATECVRPDRLIVVGEYARYIGEEAACIGIPVQHLSIADEAAQVLRLGNDKRCLVLVKGSRGMRLERVFEALSRQALVSV